MPPRVIVAIAGGSGAGKSTLAHALAAQFGENALVIAEDDYYRCSSDVVDFDPARYDFDRLEAKELALLGAHLQALRRGETVAAPQYDFTTHTRLRTTRTLLPRQILIVEGICAFASPDVRAAADFTVLLDAPDDIRLARRLLRDIAERGRTAQSVVAQYFATVRPNHQRIIETQRAHADLVLAIAPDSDIARFAEPVLQALRARGLLAPE